MSKDRTVQVYRRDDGKFAWRMVAANGQIIATDGGQGYERRIDAERMAHSILGGDSAEAEQKRDDAQAPTIRTIENGEADE